MAEGILSDVLGGDDDWDELEAKSLGTADAFAAAVAAKLAGGDSGVALRTEEFLEDQSRLLKLQAKHLTEEHTARLHFLQGQAREVDIRRFGLRLRVGFQLFVALVATVLGVGFAVLIYDAVTSRTVVIDAIDVAPNIASQAPSGKIVAAGLLDVLSRIQAATHANAEHRELSNAWANDIAIEVPETGVSIGQLERLVKARFGHDQHIGGDLTRTVTGGLALTVRGTGILAKTFTNEKGELDALLVQAGEYLYGQADPGLWAVYLTRNARDEETIQFVKGVYGAVDNQVRPILLNAWANSLTNAGGANSMQQALTLYREALRLKPDYWTAYNNIMFVLAGTGEEEEIMRVTEQLKKAAGGRPGRAPEKFYGNYDQMVWNLAAARASSLGDLEANSGIGTGANIGASPALGVARIDLQMHDPVAAKLRVDTIKIDPTVAIDVANQAITNGLLAEQSGDWKTAASYFETFASVYRGNAGVSTGNPQDICYAAVTYQKVGQPVKADAALEPSGGYHFVDCSRFKADVLDLRGDWSGAQEWYAKAVKLAPSVPSGYYSWGLALAKHGDLSGAAAKFSEANRTGPNWADPLKAWGDVLVRQGETREAARKYDEALKRAPNWKELRDARAALAAKQS